MSDNYVSVRRPEQELKRLDTVAPATGKVGNAIDVMGEDIWPTEGLLTEDSYHSTERGWEPKVFD